MKKLLVLLIALTLTGVFTYAQDTGLSVGLEFGIEEINKPNDAEDFYPYLMPMIIYENSFLDDALDVYSELFFRYDFTKAPEGYDEDSKEVNPMSLYFNLALGYNIGLGRTSILSLRLENDNEFQLSPRYDEYNLFNGHLTPGIKFTQGTAFGDFYGQIDYPFYYRQFEKEADFTSGLDFTLGWESDFGLGFKIKECNSLQPDIEWFYHFDATLYFETDLFYAEVEANIPREIEEGGGITITPWLECYFGNFTFYIFSSFSNIGTDLDLGISPGLGVKFSF